MPNLLPKKNKKDIFREFLTRFFVIFFVFSFFTLCISVVVLTPSYVLSLVKESSIKNERDLLGKNINSQEDSATNIIERERKKIEVISEVAENNIMDIFSEVIKIKPKNIKIRGLFYDKEGDRGVFVIRGTANDRNILVDFINEIEKKSNFEEVDFPVSNLIKDESFDFSVKISVI